MAISEIFQRALSLGTGMLLLFASSPSSTNYTLKTYDFGSGGGISTSTNYGLASISGTAYTTSASSTNYKLGSGLEVDRTAAVPLAPTLTNPANAYDSLKLVLNPGTNPSDTKYLIAISSNSFATTNYVQTTDAIGATGGASNFQTYTSWGGSSGFTILGLSQNTTYQVKIQSLKGKYTGSSFSSVASATTGVPSLSFGLTTSLTGTPPFTAAFTNLTPGTVQTANATANLSLTSNADNGGGVYVKDTNNGLTSSSNSYTVSSATTNLTTATNGYGAQVQTVAQTSGGPLSSTSPYNGTVNNVGALTVAAQQLLSTTNPVTSGSATIGFLAKSDVNTPAASDYSDTLTFTAAMIY